MVSMAVCIFSCFKRFKTQSSSCSCKVFYEIVNAKLLGQNTKAAILFELLLCELLESPCGAPLNRTAEHIKDLIHQNPERFFSNTELARQAGVSLKSAETKFKAQFGVTIHQYMLQFKTEQAILLLKNFSEVQIKEIAYNLGFYDEYHFSKQFKKTNRAFALLLQKALFVTAFVRKAEKQK